MSDIIEVPIGNWIASFDSRVLEIFGSYKEGSIRYHVQLLGRVWIDGRVLNAEFERSEQGFWPFDETQRAGVEALVAAVQSAQGNARLGT